MTEHRARLFLIGTSQRLLEQRTYFSDVMKQCSLNGNVFVKPSMIGHNSSYISYILQVLKQTYTPISFSLRQYFLMDIHRLHFCHNVWPLYSNQPYIGLLLSKRL